MSEVISDSVSLVGKYTTLKEENGSYYGQSPFSEYGVIVVRPGRYNEIVTSDGFKGDLVDFCSKIQKISKKESREALGLEEKKIANIERYYAINMDATVYYYKNLKNGTSKEACKYVEKRGFTARTCCMFGIGYADKESGLHKYLKEKGYTKEEIEICGLGKMSKSGSRFYDPMYGRLIFPIRDIAGHVIGFGGRLLDDGKPKYLNTPENPIFKKRENLFGYNLCKNKSNKILLSEGYADVITLAQAGFPAAASLGTALTPEQIDMLNGKEIYLAYDMDEPGRNASQKAYELLKEHDMSCRIINMKNAKDPDEFINSYGVSDMVTAMKRSEPGELFNIRRQAEIIISENGENSPKFKQRIEYIAAENLSTVPENNKEKYINAVSSRYKLNPANIYIKIEMYRNFGPNTMDAFINDAYKTKKKKKEQKQKDSPHPTKKEVEDLRSR